MIKNFNLINFSYPYLEVLNSKKTPFEIYLLKNGGGIHINPKNKGKFNETKKRTGKTTEELLHSPDPLTRKRAQFAMNARK